MPKSSIAAATVSPLRASTGSPSMVIGTVLGAASSGNRWNIESPGSEWLEFLGGQATFGDARREKERVRGGERHAAVARGVERAGTARRLVVDRKAVLRHDAQARP